MDLPAFWPRFLPAQPPRPFFCPQTEFHGCYEEGFVARRRSRLWRFLGTVRGGGTGPTERGSLGASERSYTFLGTAVNAELSCLPRTLAEDSVRGYMCLKTTEILVRMKNGKS